MAAILNGPRPTIGVVLCSYNGERYIGAQVRSIFAQTRKPDLLVACDDASRDGTVTEIEACVAQAPFPVRIMRNARNLGYVQNFAQAILRCEADIIVLSDQDDCWRQGKLERIEAVFRGDTGAGGVFSDAEIVDQELNPLGYGLLDALNASNAERAHAQAGRLMPVLLRRNIVAGATLAFRASWKDRVLPIPEGAVHDEWIALVIAAHGALRFIPEGLIHYRQHAANQIGARRLTWEKGLRSLRGSRRAEIESFLTLISRLQERLRVIGAPRPALVEVEGKIAHLQRRISLPDTQLMRTLPIVREVVNGGYARYSSGWRAVVRDLLSSM